MGLVETVVDTMAGFGDTVREFKTSNRSTERVGHFCFPHDPYCKP